MFDCTLLEDGYLKCKACSKTFFTKGAFKIHSIKEHGPTVKETNQRITQVGLQSIEKTEKNKLNRLVWLAGWMVQCNVYLLLVSLH